MSIYRIVVLGEPGVGKSCLSMRLVTDQFVGEYDPTIEDSFRKQVKVDDDTVVMDILDTAGRGEPPVLLDMLQSACIFSVRSGEGYLVMYSTIDRSTFEEIPKYFKVITEIKGPEYHCAVLVGGKVDLKEERKVEASEGQELAQHYGIPFFETSAKTSVNVEEAFHQLVREMSKRLKQEEPKPSKTKRRCVMM